MLEVLNGSSNLNRSMTHKILGKSIRVGQTVTFHRYDVPYPDSPMSGIVQGFEQREGRWIMRLKHGTRTEIHPIHTIVDITVKTPFKLV